VKIILVFFLEKYENPSSIVENNQGTTLEIEALSCTTFHSCQPQRLDWETADTLLSHLK
jgi:hypothetical protein